MTWLWNVSSDAIAPISADIQYGEHSLWFRVIESVQDVQAIRTCVQYLNEVAEHGDVQWDLRSMDVPRGIEPPKKELFSVFGRAPFEIYGVDTGWILEMSNGMPVGYLHMEWALHLPQDPCLDPQKGLAITLHEIALHPNLRGKGLGKKMLNHAMEQVQQHILYVEQVHPRLASLHWDIQCNAEAISKDGQTALEYLRQHMTVQPSVNMSYLGRYSVFQSFQS